MKKILALLCMSIILGAANPSLAKEHKNCWEKSDWNTGGYIANENNISTVANVTSMPDESFVTLKGQIEKQIKKDKYLFKDKTGTIVVEIKKHTWQGQNITPSDVILISGELDKDGKETKVEVDSLTKSN